MKKHKKWYALKWLGWKVELALAFAALMFIVAGFILGNVVTVYSNLNFIPKSMTSSNHTNCSDMGLVDTAACLKNQVSAFYYYNISNVGKDLTEEELKQQGGVCKHYAEWYSNQAQNLGFYTKEIVFSVGDLNHEVALISNNEGYCVLDQTSAHCWFIDTSID
jgi:hypothetical protein